MTSSPAKRQQDDSLEKDIDKYIENENNNSESDNSEEDMTDEESDADGSPQEKLQHTISDLENQYSNTKKVVSFEVDAPQTAIPSLKKKSVSEQPLKRKASNIFESAVDYKEDDNGLSLSKLENHIR